MNKFQHYLSLAFACLVFLFSLVTMWRLMAFLGRHHHDPISSVSSGQSPLFYLWLDSCLVGLFILQHSYFKTNQIALHLRQWSVNPSLARCTYTLLTSLALQVVLFSWKEITVTTKCLGSTQALVAFWTPLFSYIVWNVSDSSVLSSLLAVSQWVAWAFIYGGSLLLDFPELVGVKQVTFNLVLKTVLITLFVNVCTPGLLQLPQHSYFIRSQVYWVAAAVCPQEAPQLPRNDCGPLVHPSHEVTVSLSCSKETNSHTFTHCSLDRILLASTLTLYMAVAWEPTIDDNRYHRRQLLQKRQEMEYTYRRQHLSRSTVQEFRNIRGWRGNWWQSTKNRRNVKTQQVSINPLHN